MTSAADIIQIQIDAVRYDEIQEELQGLLREGKGGSYVFQKLWQESEDIKNRHGGMPPKVES